MCARGMFLINKEGGGKQRGLSPFGTRVFFILSDVCGKVRFLRDSAGRNEKNRSDLQNPGLYAIISISIAFKPILSISSSRSSTSISHQHQVHLLQRNKNTGAQVYICHLLYFYIVLVSGSLMRLYPRGPGAIYLHCIAQHNNFQFVAVVVRFQISS